MENKITLRFKLDNLQKIGFDGENLEQEFFEGLQTLHDSGIEINANHFDDLCQSTINDGHNLLKSNGIFNIDKTVMEPISHVIGQYLFRLLFGHTKFQSSLHKAKLAKRELEIILEFDLTKPESKDLATLPWELMYCPENKIPTEKNIEEEDEDKIKQNGFFIAQVASIYRKYQKVDEKENEIKRKVVVAIAFLTKDIENLSEVYQQLKERADKIESQNNNIRFEFINVVKNETVHLLTKEDLSRIFLGDKKQNAGEEIHKIVHIICDISTTEYKTKTEKALYFNNIGIKTESIGYTEIIQELFNKSLLPDPFLKLIVLQTWKDENRFSYSGFEELAYRIMRKTQTAFISMPYLLNQAKSEDGKAVFFETLYQGLANGMSIIQIVQKLRNDIVQRYSYGFPILYLDGQDLVLVSQDNTAPKPMNINTTKSADAEMEEQFLSQYQHLDKESLEETRKSLKEKLVFVIKDADTTVGSIAKYANKKETDKINVELSAIEKLLINKTSNP